MQQGAVGFCTEHHLFILKEEEGEGEGDEDDELVT